VSGLLVLTITHLTRRLQSIRILHQKIVSLSLNLSLLFYPPTCLHLPFHLNRSCTPNPVFGDLASVDHVPLSCCAAEPFSDILPANGKHDPATRQIASANKLTRMGFSAKDGWEPAATISMSPRGHDQKSRFSIKSLQNKVMFYLCVLGALWPLFLCVRCPLSYYV
jgi:hypothetical protein